MILIPRVIKTVKPIQLANPSCHILWPDEQRMELKRCVMIVNPSRKRMQSDRVRSYPIEMMLVKEKTAEKVRVSLYKIKSSLVKSGTVDPNQIGRWKLVALCQGTVTGLLC